MSKRIFYLIISVILFISGIVIGQQQSESTTIFFTLNENIVLYQEGIKIGELYSGAQLNYEKGMDEGYQVVTLTMNFYEQPDSLKYYEYKNTDVENLTIPCWNNKDVSIE